MRCSMMMIMMMMMQLQRINSDGRFLKWIPTGSAVCAHGLQEAPGVCVWRLPPLLLLRPSDNHNESIVAAQITRMWTFIWLCKSYPAHISCALRRWWFCTFPASHGGREHLANSRPSPQRRAITVLSAASIRLDSSTLLWNYILQYCKLDVVILWLFYYFFFFCTSVVKFKHLKVLQ